MKSIIISLLLLILINTNLKAQPERLLEFVDGYDICVFPTTKDIPDSFGIAYETFTVDSTKSQFESALKLEQTLGFIAFNSQSDPFYQGTCPNISTLSIDRFQVDSEVDGVIELVHSAKFTLGSGFWGVHVRAKKQGRENSKWDNPFFIQVVYDLGDTVPMVPIIIYFKIIE